MSPAIGGDVDHQHSPQPKRPYAAPEVVELGTLVELTRGGGNTPATDGALSAAMP